ncbi:MAG: helix-turn-helix domain-containing protein [Gammaproteobacteria bacterium SHHR-1]
MTALAELKTELLNDPKAQAEYERLGPEYALARELIAARARAGLSQSDLAERMHTSQSAVARMESGKTLPSLRSLSRYAEATGCKAVVRLEAQRPETNPHSQR